MRNALALPAIETLKDQARRLKTRLSADGETVSHSRALELIAAQYGYRDWNTLHAAAGNRQHIGDMRPGAIVSGTYLGQPFKARLLGIEQLAHAPDSYRVKLDLEEAVDVISFPSFSSFRKRVRGTVGEDGVSRERTSNGVPHLELHW